MTPRRSRASEWRGAHTEQYEVLCRGGTEALFTGKYAFTLTAPTAAQL
jgi:hypothetical protein